MKLNILVLLFICVTFHAYAQPDSEQKSIKIPAKETKEKDSTPLQFEIKPNQKVGITNTKKNIDGIPVKVLPSLKKPKKEFSMFDDNGLRDPGEIFEKRYNARAVEQGYKIESMPDQFLGDVRINGEFANIMCRDHEFPDGDMVRIFVNDEVFIPSLVLASGYKSFNVPLKQGINKIVFLALNQGDSGPNTAEFKVFDDNQMQVSSKRWNLLTGVKATILVIKDENMPKLKKSN
ncbi:hypothetical protein [uncultured Psychroserpens sp.]|uniref:hypothetical protein n=1 Tax=uncultured Psychroserpens sp. TaxID=255436 RepID=UPI0026144CEF|nr:hypothetical protein [uncultured Psychroserpens sp.]